MQFCLSGIRSKEFEICKKSNFASFDVFFLFAFHFKTQPYKALETWPFFDPKLRDMTSLIQFFFLKKK